jgi:DNA-binding transcriptional MerR regulator
VTNLQWTDTGRVDAMDPFTKDLPDKLYFKIGEVSRITGLAPYVLRFWEGEFKTINPKRTASGQRLYRRRDIALILRIKHLLYDKKFTIQGAAQHLRTSAKQPPWETTEKKLLEIRDGLAEIRELLS